MKNIKYISAGAGSGKTYRLTHDLASFIKEEKVRPEEVIMATFTDKAASELREKARSVLYEEKLYDAAIQLDQSMIGTIHSVGYSFIERYWYMLGLNCKLNIMADADVDFYINQSLANIASTEDLQFFKEFRDYFDIKKSSGNNYAVADDDFWKLHLKNIIEKLRSGNITFLDQSKELSLNAVEGVFNPDNTITQVSNEAIHGIMQEIYDACKKKGGDNNTAKERIDKFSKLIEKKNWLFCDICSLSSTLEKLPQGIKKECPNLDAFLAQICNIWHLPDVTNKIKDYIDRIFKLADSWLKQYQEYKKFKSIIDYNDMESLFLKLLEQEHIKEEIAGKYKYIFVDEFQDCNPTQVKIFSLLSDLVEQSIWVGDSKQAIYGFRGTDSALTDSVARYIESKDNNNFETLGTSYRSLPKIVEVVNSFFFDVFVTNFNMFADTNRVTLNVDENKITTDANRNTQLQAWYNIGRADSVYPQLAYKVASMINDDGILPKDIAILTRANSDSNKVAQALANLGLPVNQNGNGTSSSDDDIKLNNQKEIYLVTSIISYIIDNHDDLAKAQILYLTQENTPIENIIDNRLSYLNDKEDSKNKEDEDDEQSPLWLQKIDFIKVLEADRKKLSQLSITSLVESIIVKYDLYSIVSRWGDGSHRKANLDGLINLARQYEDRCVTMTIGASPIGFLEFLKKSNIQEEGDAEGVFVNTYHKSKGLEWNHVILLSLDNNPADDNRRIKMDFLGVQLVDLNENDDDQAAESEIRYTNKAIQLLPNVFGNKNAPDDIKNTITEMRAYVSNKSKVLHEEARLMYVGMTRAKESLILVSKERSNFDWLRAISTKTITVPSANNDAEDVCDVLGTGIPELYFHTERLEAVAEAVTEEDNKVCKIVKLTECSDSHNKKLRYQSPSTIDKTSTEVTEKFDFESRIALSGVSTEDDMAIVGDCVHDIFCVLIPHDTDNNQAKANRLITDYNMQNHLRCDDIISIYDRFFDKMIELFGNASSIYHELPFFYPEAGSIIRGSMDFVYETSNGCILVDFKTNPEGKRVLDKTNKHYAGNYNSQFTCYATALQKADKTVIEKLVFYPISGLIVKLE